MTRFDGFASRQRGIALKATEQTIDTSTASEKFAPTNTSMMFCLLTPDKTNEVAQCNSGPEKA
jgi:hypothetical protein